MTNTNDAVEDYSSTQFFKWQSGHGKLSPIANSGGIEEASLRMAKIYQEGSIHGAEIEQGRITSLAWDWISEMRGHDGECSCRHEASILQQFVEHPDFKGE